ncbi:hypothetical protein [Chryseobacterium luteum]|uniref:Uncharacterized protein n=1 Tax=Chryseobacterium luteum TaxID=421531 RepID=A0A085ZXI6_9FLAO|nr:hypothetical protein [Chryseobacterium luteum]KFF09150.1 hypothetical protein IX38_01130 [Chryseobacterium luteum]
MSNIIIYKNGKRKIDAGTDWDYEKFKDQHGYYSIINLMLKLLEDVHELLQKIKKEEDFVLNVEEKNILARKLEAYIDKDIKNFKNEDELENHNKIPYKGIVYRCPIKANDSTLEKKLAKAISLYNQFNDPDGSNIVEFKFTKT